MSATPPRFAQIIAEQLFAERVANSKTTCGGCTMCCHLVPNDEIRLPPFTACPHERAFPHAQLGCAIYPQRPASCRTWFCQYRLEDWDVELRPDHCGVVVDPLPDVIRFRATTGEAHEMPAVQMWAAAGSERAFDRQPVLALVLAAIDAVGAVVWRYRGPDGVGLGIGLTRHQRRPTYGHGTRHRRRGIQQGTRGRAFAARPTNAATRSTGHRLMTRPTLMFLILATLTGCAAADHLIQCIAGPAYHCSYGAP